MVDVSKLKEYKSTLEKSGVLTKAEKDYIRDLYNQNGRELNTKRGCSNCWIDALIILIIENSDNKIIMVGGAVIKYNDVLYTRINITDIIATKIMAEMPENEKYFIRK